ncbi:MAG: AbrB family transcriptional regulator [Pseudomonadota bacterium]
MPHVTTFVVAGIGVVVFHLVNLPLPWLLGPMAACLIAALAGVDMKGIAPLNDAMRTILGVAVGATFTPAVFLAMTGMWPTLLLIPVMVLCVGLVGVPYFRLLWRFDFPTSYYGAMPGGLSDMLVFGEEAGGNIRTLSLIHATRVMVIVAALPFLLQGIWGADLGNPPGAPARDIPVYEMILMLISAVVGWQLFKRLNLFGASILGPLVVTGILAISGFLTNRPPVEAIWAAQFFIGMSVGIHYVGITMAEIRRDLLASVGFCILLILLTFPFVELVYLAGLAPGTEALLAFAPGGQAELTVLALVVGADMAFVIAHHVLRILVVILGAPLFARLLDR